MLKPRPEWITRTFGAESQITVVLVKLGLDLNDPEVEAELSEPSDFETLNRRLYALLARRYDFPR